MKGADDTERMCLSALCLVLEESGATTVEDIANACQMMIHVASVICAGTTSPADTMRRMDDMRGIIAACADDTPESAPAGVPLQ